MKHDDIILIHVNNKWTNLFPFSDNGWFIGIIDDRRGKG